MLRVMTRLHGQARSVSHTYIHTYTSICTLLAFSTETLPWRCCAPSRIAEPCAGGAAPSRAARTCTRRAAQRGTRGALAERHRQLCCGQVGRKHAPCAERAGQRVLGGCGAGRPAPGVIPDPMISGGAARRPSRWVGSEPATARRARWAGEPAAQAAPQAKAWRACGARSQAGVGPPSLRRKKPSGARAGAHLVPAGGAGTERRRFLSSLRRTPIDAARCALASFGVRAARARLRRKQKPIRGRTGSRRHSNGNGGTGRTQGRRARAMPGAHPLKASSVRRCRRRRRTPSRARA